MCESLIHSGAFFALAFFASSSGLAVTPPAPWTVGIQPARLVNGTPVLFRATTPTAVRTLSGSWLGHYLVFSFEANSKTWFALAGVSQETKPGAYSLVL